MISPVLPKHAISNEHFKNYPVSIQGLEALNNLQIYLGSHSQVKDIKYIPATLDNYLATIDELLEEYKATHNIAENIPYSLTYYDNESFGLSVYIFNHLGELFRFTPVFIHPSYLKELFTITNFLTAPEEDNLPTLEYHSDSASYNSALDGDFYSD